MFKIDLMKEKPIFINKNGTKFWVEPTLTNYAKKLNLKNVIVYLIQTPDNIKDILIVENGEPIFNSSQTEAIAVHLDIMKLKNQKF